MTPDQFVLFAAIVALLTCVVLTWAFCLLEYHREMLAALRRAWDWAKVTFTAAGDDDFDRAAVRHREMLDAIMRGCDRRHQ